MAVTCGFFASKNGDRKYDNNQFARLFDGIIKDGVFINVGKAFKVHAATGTSVYVESGLSWFNHTWTYNDSVISVDMTNADVLNPRIDAVVLEVDNSQGVRNNRIFALKGTASPEPVKPKLVHDNGVDQYALAYIMRKPNANTISDGDITYNVGQSSCPFVSGILETINADNVTAKWEARFKALEDSLVNNLSTNQAANLQMQINELKANKPSYGETLPSTGKEGQLFILLEKEK